MKIKNFILFLSVLFFAYLLCCNYAFTQPSAPPAPSTTNYVCGNQTLTASSPPANVLYYWSTGCDQSTALGYATTYTVTATGTYYLQAYDTISALWSQGCGSVLSTINSTIVPADPPSITENVDVACGLRKTLTTSAPPAGTTYFWQGTTCGRDSSASSASPDTVDNTCGIVTYYLRAKFTTSDCWSYNCSSIDINEPRTLAPCTPPNPTFSCGSSQLTRPNPPTNITYYWQGTSCVADESNSAATYNTSGTNIYYLKAKDNCTGLWSGSCSSVNYVSGASISDPTAITQNTPACGLKYLTIGAPPGGVTYYWQGTSCATSTTYDAASPYTISYICTNNLTYYARAQDDATGCWSNGCSSTVINRPLEPNGPCAPPAPTTTSYPTGCQTLTRSALPSGIIYYWQGTSCNMSKSDTNSTYIATATNTYYLRAYDNCDDSWSTCSSVLSTVTSPTVADPVNNPTTTNNSCGCQTLTRGDNPPSGVAYYWQTACAGTDMSDSNATTEVCATGNYFIRAVDTCTGTWSVGCKFVASTMINPLPGAPPAITVNEPVCGSSDFKNLTVGSPPAGVTYFWQGTTCSYSEADTANDAYEVSHIGTETCSTPAYYYARAKDNATECWSLCNDSRVYITNPRADTPCDPPTPTTTSNPQGCQTLTRSDPPPSGVTYYWQGTNCGTTTGYGSAVNIQVSATGWYSIRARNNCTGAWSTNCDSVLSTVNPISVANPPTPTTTDSSCGNQSLTRGGNPPDGIRYYWQGTSCGTSTSYGYGANYTVTTTGKYYIRARDVCTGTWSTGCDSVTSTVYNPVPATPSAITVNTPACGYKYLSVDPYSPPANVSYYWQGTSCGTSTAEIGSDNDTLQGCSASYYYLRAQDDITGCWSINCSSVYVSNPRTTNPCDPPAPTTTSNPFGCQTITRATPPSGVTYYWQGTSCDQIITLGSDVTYTAPVTGSYNLRARYNCAPLDWSTGCGAVWSTVNGATPDNPPNPTTTSGGCGNQTLTRDDPPPSGVTYYWQGTDCNANDQSNSALTYTVTATGTYYLKAFDNCSGGWSDGCGSVVSTINKPTSPAITENAAATCSDLKTLTAPAPPADVTYYWQGESCGTITSSPSSSPYTVTNYCTSEAHTYYLKAKNDVVGCWADNCSSVSITSPRANNPCSPGTPTTTNIACGNQTLTRVSAPPTCITYYWQGTNCAANSTANDASSPYTVTATDWYYIKARDNITDAWSLSCDSVESTINNPATPAAIIENAAASCSDRKTLTTAASPPAGVTYYWQGTSCGTSTANNASSPYTCDNVCTSSRTYYLKAQDDNNLCWSTNCSQINITNPYAGNPCTPGNPTTNNVCGDQTLTRTGAPTTCVTWYWQGQNCDAYTMALGSGATYTATSTGTYYIRARNELSGNWSTTCGSVAVVIKPKPADPPAPTKQSTCADYYVLTAATPPADVTYYWQGTTCNTLTSNSWPTYKTSVITTNNVYYYLRAKSTTNGCWSSACGSVATPDGATYNGLVATWAGGSGGSKDWDVGANWDCGGVPNSVRSALIPTFPLYLTSSGMPVVSSNNTSEALNVTINSSASVTINDGFDLSVYGNWSNSGVDSVGSGGGTTIFKGTVLQSISGSSTTRFDSVRIDNSNGISLSSISVRGDWINNAFSGNPTGTVTFSGGIPQAIRGSTASTFTNLTINNSDATGVTLSKPTTVTGSLTLTQGKVNTDATNILILSSAATSGQGNANSFVNGPMRKQGLSAGSFVFPVGKDTEWARIGLSNIGGAGPSDFLAEYYNSSYSSTAVDATLTWVSDQIYWILNRETNTAIGDITLYWEDVSTTGLNYNCGDVRVAHWNSVTSKWEDYTGNASGNCSGTGAGSVTTTTPASVFSPIAPGADAGALPIQLLYFNASILSDNTVLCDWKTVTEINNDYFTVEKTIDGINFVKVGIVKGAGNSNTLLSYSIIDMLPYYGTSYYRLKQTDYNGKTETFQLVPISLQTEGSIPYVFIYPTVTSNGIHVELPSSIGDKVLIEITDVMSKKVIEKTVTSYIKERSIQEFDVSSLSEGIYFITVKSSTTNELLGMSKFVKVK